MLQNVNEIQDELGEKYKVKINQIWVANIHKLVVKGRNFQQAIAELVPILHEINELNLPDDWVNAIKQKIQQVNFDMHDIAAGTDAFLKVE